MERKYYRKSPRLRAGKKRHGKINAGYGKPRMAPGLRATFRKIGVPRSEPFRPDQFQLAALNLIRDYDVLVSAPTGAGKTWIASQAIHSYLAADSRVWYASPLKALSNSIYQEFCHEFGPSYCGILTGDRKENPGARVIVGTTEILRNQLYDAMHDRASISTDLAILDEAHYLNDPDRGVVWEEVLIYLPSRVRLLLLSATISNAEEVCEWLEDIRGIPCRVVRSAERPVPLEMLFLFHDGLIAPLAGKKGLSPEVKRFLASKARGRRRAGRINFGSLIVYLRQLDLLPAIFFLKSRSDCDRAVLSCPHVNKASETKDRLRVAVRKFLDDYPHLERHRQMGPLLESMVASHHGGQLPYWKVLIEKMMNKGYLEAIFSTSTVAAGVNFPARTVILVQSDRYNGHEFIDLTATDLHQMIGRAGRRGKDNIGFAVVIPGLHQDPQLIHELRDSVPEPIVSQIHINFSMTLNLLLSHTPLEVKDLLEHSFAVFQQRESEASSRIRWDEKLSRLDTILPAAKCDVTDPYEVMENIQKMSELQREFKTMTQAIRYAQLADAFREYLKPGRLILHKNKSIYVVFRTYTDQGRLMCAAHNVKRSVRTRKGRPRLSKVSLNQIKAIFDHQVDLSENHSAETVGRQFDTIPLEDLKPLNIENTDPDTGSKDSYAIKLRMSTLQCEGCEHQETCHGARKGPLWKLLQDFRALAVRMEGMHGGLWLSFKRHVRFLKETGFVDEMSRLTSDGYWASKLRLDQPLLIAEAIRKGAFDGVSPEILAGGLAPFVWDKAQEMELNLKGAVAMTELEGILNRILDHIEQIRSLKDRRGFDSPPIMLWPAAAVFMWAKRVPWEKLLDFVHVDEGDLASLIMRTADHLRQITNLWETHPELASVAEKGIELILREPVYIH